MKVFSSFGCSAAALALAIYAAPAYANHHEDKEKNETAECASAYGQSRAEEAKSEQKAKKNKGKRKGKDKGDKGGTEDINIGIGELNEGCAQPGAVGDMNRDEHSDHENSAGEKSGTEDINIGVGEMQECMAAMRGDEEANRESCMERIRETAKNRSGDHRHDEGDEAEEHEDEDHQEE